MRLVCGDDNGLVKSVQAFPPAEKQEIQPGATKKSGANPKHGLMNQKKTPSNDVVKIWGTQNREAQVQSLCWVENSESEQVMVALNDTESILITYAEADDLFYLFFSLLVVPPTALLMSETVRMAR